MCWKPPRAKDTNDQEAIPHDTPPKAPLFQVIVVIICGHHENVLHMPMHSFMWSERMLLLCLWRVGTILLYIRKLTFQDCPPSIVGKMLGSLCVCGQNIVEYAEFSTRAPFLSLTYYGGHSRINLLPLVRRCSDRIRDAVVQIPIFVTTADITTRAIRHANEDCWEIIFTVLRAGSEGKKLVRHERTSATGEGVWVRTYGRSLLLSRRLDGVSANVSSQR